MKFFTILFLFFTIINADWLYNNRCIDDFYYQDDEKKFYYHYSSFGTNNRYYSTNNLVDFDSLSSGFVYDFDTKRCDLNATLKEIKLNDKDFHFLFALSGVLIGFTFLFSLTQILISRGL